MWLLHARNYEPCDPRARPTFPLLDSFGCRQTNANRLLEQRQLRRSSFVASVLNDPATTRFEWQASGSAKVDETKARKTEMKREAKMVDLESARLVRFVVATVCG